MSRALASHFAGPTTGGTGRGGLGRGAQRGLQQSKSPHCESMPKRLSAMSRQEFGREGADGDFSLAGSSLSGPRLWILEPQGKYPYFPLHSVRARRLALEGRPGRDYPALIRVVSLGVDFKVIDGQRLPKGSEKPFVRAPGHILIPRFAAAGIVQDVVAPCSPGMPWIHKIAHQHQKMVGRGIAHATFAGTLEGGIENFVADDVADDKRNLEGLICLRVRKCIPHSLLPINLVSTP